MSVSESNLSSLWNDPTLLGQLLPGVNVQGLQESLQAEETQAAAPVNQLSQDQQTLSSQAQAYSTVQGALQTVYSDATALEQASAFQQTGTPAVSDSSVLTAAATPNASATGGTYAVSVSSLASSASLYSQSLATDPTQPLGWTGTLNFTVDAGLSQTPTTFTVQIQSGDSLDAVAQSINNAAAAALPDGTTLSASVLPTSTGGTAGNVLSLEVNGGLTGSQITASAGSNIPSLNWTQNTTYSPADFTVNGVPNQSTSNVITSAIPGVTMNLLATGSSVVAVPSDPGATADQVNTLINDIQTAISTIQGQTGPGGVLAGDGALNSLVSQLEDTLTSNVGGQPIGYQSLADIGLSESYSQSSGMSITFDSTAFTQALQTDPGAVTSMFTGSNGVAQQVASLVNSFTAPSSGILASDQTNIQNQEAQLSNQEAALEQSVTMEQTMLQNEFTTSLQTITQNMSQTQYVQEYVAQVYGQNSSGSSSSSSGG